MNNKQVREAKVEAEFVNLIAAQIRILRQQRGWNQEELAKKMGTTQGVVSRLEDPSYGRFTFKTLLNLSAVFDVALFVRFIEFSQFVPATWDTKPESLRVEPFDEDVKKINFYSTLHETLDSNVFSSNFLPPEFLSKPNKLGKLQTRKFFVEDKSRLNEFELEDNK